MILGSIAGLPEVSNLEPTRLELVSEAAIDEFRTNPVIDEEVRKNRVIMRELRNAVAKHLPAAARARAQGPTNIQGSPAHGRPERGKR